MSAGLRLIRAQVPEVVFNFAADLPTFQYMSHSSPPFCLGAVPRAMLPLISLAEMQGMHALDNLHLPALVNRAYFRQMSSCLSI